MLASCAREEKKAGVIEVGNLIKGEFLDGVTLDSATKAFDKRRTALVTIDVQNEFCDPYGARGNQETYDIAKRISEQAPAFRAVNVDVVNIYSRNNVVKDTGFYYYRPDKRDVNFRKAQNSPFWDGPAADSLFRARGKTTLLMCGFNMSACVRATALTAREKGYDVYIMVDMVGDDRKNTPSDPKTAAMAQRGIKFILAE